MGLTGKRLFQYAMLYKKPIIGALVLLLLAVTAELAGPFIAKRMIDQNILGIEKTWYETAKQDSFAVEHNGKWYKRVDHLSAGEPQGESVRILQSGRTFYWLEGKLPFEDGKRKVEGQQMTLTSKATGEMVTFPVTALSAKELFAFYKPETPGIIKLAALYCVLLLIGGFLTYGQRLLLQTSANSIVRRMRNDVFEHTQRLPVNYYDTLAAGQVVSRITNDTEAVRELYVSVLANFFSAIIYMSAIYVALFFLDWRLALFALPLVPLLLVWIKVYRRFAATTIRLFELSSAKLTA